jgi:dTDP-4-dehydrorhamnose reductase
VINTAAFHRVDDCELDATSAFAVNAVAVHELARTCRELDAVLMHLSTDYVFGAERARSRPYAESDAPGPVSVYGASKLAGEHLLRSSWSRHFVVRSSGLYGRATSQSKGGNFVEIMLRMASVGRPLRVVADQRLAPTSTHALAQRLVALLDTDAYGLYHLTAGGECSWYEFGRPSSGWRACAPTSLRPPPKPTAPAPTGRATRCSTTPRRGPWACRRCHRGATRWPSTWR